MFENLAAIDIGTSSVKLVTAKTGLRDFQVTSFTYQDIDYSIGNYEEALKDALSRLLRENDLKGYTLMTNLPMEKAIIRNITFPFNDIEKIAEAIPFEAEENIPFKIEDLSLDFQSLKSKNQEEGRILMAATHKDTLHDFLHILSEFQIKPIRMGLESNALFECYRYFNTIEDETVLQIDIGHNKSIVNIINNNNLLYTRSISIGLELIYEELVDDLEITFSDAVRVFENLHLDLTSLDNNYQRDFYKAHNLNKAKLKSIYDKSLEVVKELIEQIALTIKAFYTGFGELTINRFIISGGGSNILGIGQLISSEFDAPVVSLPFLEGYTEIKIRTQFPIAFGTLLCHLNRKRPMINFLKGEFLPDLVSESKKVYYLSGAFGVLSVIILVAYFIISTILESSTNKKYEALLQERFKRYFYGKHLTGDPIKEATRILEDERKEYDSIKAILKSDDKVLDVLKDILSYFPKDESFELKSLVINERIIRFDGTLSSSKPIDDFKNKLTESRLFDSVTLNTNINKRNQVLFSMNIKLKIPEDEQKRLKSKGK